jgi:biopolymer transport protein ExbD
MLPGTPISTRQPQTEINMIPLIDIMLVLLVIFLVTAPLLTHAVRINLPKANSTAVPLKQNSIQLGVYANGKITWNGDVIEPNELEIRMASSAAQGAQSTELHIYADAQTSYENVAKLMAMASRAGIGRIGFVSTPEKGQRNSPS